MQADIQYFIQPIARVIVTTLFAVFTVAFVSVPYSLGAHPGDPQTAQAAEPRHLT